MGIGEQMNKEDKMQKRGFSDLTAHSYLLVSPCQLYQPVNF